MILRAAVRPTAETLALAASVRRQARVAVLTNNNLLVKRAADTVFPELRPIFGPNFLFQASFTRGSPNRRPIFVAWRTLALRRKPRFSSMIAPGTWPGRSALGCKHIYIGAPTASTSASAASGQATAQFMDLTSSRPPPSRLSRQEPSRS